MSDIVIRSESVGKKYTIGHQTQNGRYMTLRDTVSQYSRGLWHKTRDLVQGRPIIQGDKLEEVWALKDVSFEIKRGEAVGIIGRNGAGKSTLLKLLSRITEPSAGRVTMIGRVASLLEVGTGFHPELTGRENIYLCGAILGMSRTEIHYNFDNIVDFSGVAKYLDTPVKRYSSGMYVRLAFAVAAHLNPEILLVDEVLAVGDSEFQKKCLGKMGEVAKGGRTVLFVSHNMSAIARLCTKSILLSDGSCEYWGDTEVAISQYLKSTVVTRRNEVDLRNAPGWQPNRRVILTSISTYYLDGTPATDFKTGDGMIIKIGYDLDEDVPAYCQVNILNHLGDRVITLRSSHSHEPFHLCGCGIIECRIEDLRLVSGDYIFMAEIGRQFPYSEWLDCVPEAMRIQVRLGDYLGGFELHEGQGVMAQHSTWDLCSS